MIDSPILLRVRGLCVAIGEGEDAVRPVEGVDMEIRRGETFALLGESGCGKSMTALTLMRLLPPGGQIISGEVVLDGASLPDLSEREMRKERGGRIGMIFQEPMTSLNPVLTVGEQIAEAVRLHDPVHGIQPRLRVIELLRSVGLPDPERRIGEYPHQLSGGMKQRVMIAIALAGRPSLLIADEPTTALDVTIQAQVLDLLKGLQRQTGMSVLLITHDLGVVAETADRVGVMYAGQIVETADCGDFFRDPRHPYSRKLFQSLPGVHKRGRQLAVIRGNVPSPRHRFRGCRFAERCDRVGEPCLEQAPACTLVGMRHAVRCHFGDESPGLDAIDAEPETLDSSATTQSAPRPLIEVRQLKVHFPIRAGLLRRTLGHVRAVDGVDIAVAAGSTLALVGESGCGKTTVGKAILRLIPATAGEVLFQGEPLAGLAGSALRKRRGDMQIVFQDPYASMNPRMPVIDIVAEGLRAQGKAGKPEQLRARVAQLLQQVGLSEETLDRFPHEFSGGQRQRIAIARALALDPKLIICDEPTSALDVSVQAQILNLLKELQVQLGIGYLFITHNIAVVSYLAQEVAVMYLGRIVEYGPVEAVLEHPLHPYTRALLDAAPLAEPNRHSDRKPLQGDMPSPSAPPAGCHFHPRCPKAGTVCRESYPQEQSLANGRRLSCHYPN
ncbi:MAG: ABC transporter ATP-binding protein [Gammaproteobacteria bacterium]|nr:ABC transporter ATP-binding protein [Gammaproteobacteria bacterium]MBU1654931.1 ABC transporter ATP-binding protein [Gammaproteobacteria bacterium]MBU1962386.1 ABC transporter ATP-binding protein [Gammaproteobacteria bacterium]